MIGLVIAIHVIVCALLIIVILIQAGRGGGLVEGFSSVESMFGTKTNEFLARTTTTLAILFFITCIGLALLSARQSRSLMRSVKPQPASAAQGSSNPEALKQETPVKTETPVSPAPQPTSDAPKSQ